MSNEPRKIDKILITAQQVYIVHNIICHDRVKKRLKTNDKHSETCSNQINIQQVAKKRQGYDKNSDLVFC